MSGKLTTALPSATRGSGSLGRAPLWRSLIPAGSSGLVRPRRRCEPWRCTVAEAAQPITCRAQKRGRPFIRKVRPRGLTHAPGSGGGTAGNQPGDGARRSPPARNCWRLIWLKREERNRAAGTHRRHHRSLPARCARGREERGLCSTASRRARCGAHGTGPCSRASSLLSEGARRNSRAEGHVRCRACPHRRRSPSAEQALGADDVLVGDSLHSLAVFVRTTPGMTAKAEPIPLPRVVWIRVPFRTSFRTLPRCYRMDLLGQQQPPTRRQNDSTPRPRHSGAGLRER